MPRKKSGPSINDVLAIEDDGEFVDAFKSIERSAAISRASRQFNDRIAKITDPQLYENASRHLLRQTDSANSASGGKRRKGPGRKQKWYTKPMRTTLITALLLSLISAQPVAASTLEQRVEARRQQRLEQRQQQATEQIRLGREVRPRLVSPRRTTFQYSGIVRQVVDGSVLVVELNDGEQIVVRTLGAEAPVIEQGSAKEQCFALQSKLALEALVLGKPVQLERDREYYKDNQGRVVRYVRLGTLDVNGWMIDNGYSFADGTNAHDRSIDYLDRQIGAREEERGLWSNFCEYNPHPSVEFRIIQ